MTYYALYEASATYEFKYPGRFSNLSDKSTWRTFTASGRQLSEHEMNDRDGYLDFSETLRSDDFEDAMTKVNGTNIKVFNRDFTIDLDSPSASEQYKLSVEASNVSERTYSLSVYYYNGGANPVLKDYVDATWNTAINVTENAKLGNHTSLVTQGPSGHPEYKFVGWRKYNGTSFVGPVISTQACFGYSITGDLSIAPYFCDPTSNE